MYLFVAKPLLDGYMLAPSSHHLVTNEAELVSTLVPEASNFLALAKLVQKKQTPLNV